MNEPTVTLDEIATAQGRKAAQVRDEARELGMQVRTDWAGREALSIDEARALVNGKARRAMEHHRAWKAFQDEVKAWQDGRAAAARQAADDAEHKLRRRPRISMGRGTVSPGEVHDARREAYLHAGAQYERSNARPRWNGEPTVPLVFLDDADEEGSRKAAIVGKLRGPVRPGSERVEVA